MAAAFLYAAHTGMVRKTAGGRYHMLVGNCIGATGFLKKVDVREAAEFMLKYAEKEECLKLLSGGHWEWLQHYIEHRGDALQVEEPP